MTKARLNALCVVLSSVLLLLTLSGSAAPDARQLMQRSDQQTRSQDESVEYTMDLIDADGKVTQARKVLEYFKRKRGKDVSLHKFLSPPIVSGSGFLMIDENGKSNDIWMYTPATRRLRRISGQEKSNWYMGTEFTYEDFEDYQLDSYAFRVLREAECEAKRQCWVVEARPATDHEREASGYSKKTYWIEKESLFPVQVEYHAKGSDEVVKRLQVSGLHPIKQYWRPKVLEMSNLKNGRKTRITVVRRELDTGLGDYYVSKRFLRKD